MKNTPEVLMLAADDFGKSNTANSNILELVRLGKIDRVAILINGSIAKEEAALLLDSKIKLDIHLDLNSRFIDNKRTTSTIGRSAFFLSNYATGKRSVKKISQLWIDQCNAFYDLFGRMPDGINSHEHVHFFPPYFRIAIGLANDLKIPYMRFGSKGIVPEKTAVSRMLTLAWHMDKTNFRAGKVISSDYLVSLDWIARPEAYLNENTKKNIEVICHPEREREMNILAKINGRV